MLRARRRLAISCLLLVGAPGVLRAQPSAPPVPVARRVVRDATAAFDAGTEVAWRTGFARSLRAVPAPLAAAHLALADATLARLAFQYDAALRAYDHAARDTTAVVAAHAAMGRAAVLANRGDYARAHAAMDSAVARLALRGDVAGEAEARISLALLQVRTRGLEVARAQLAQAARLARTAPVSADIVVQSRLACATLQLDVRGGVRVADSTWTRVLDAARRAGPRYFADCGFVHAQFLSSQGRGAAAVAAFDSVAVAQTAVRSWAALSATRQWQGSELITRGFYGDAAARLDSALALARRSESRNGEAWAQLELGRIAQRLGAPADAQRHFVEARAHFVATGDRVGLVLADYARAQGVLLDGDPLEADTLLRRIMPELDAFSPQALVGVIAARASIAQRRGDAATARQLADSAEQLAARRNLPGWRVDLLYLRAVDALRRGALPDARLALDSLARLRLVGPTRFEVHTRRAEALLRGATGADAPRTRDAAQAQRDSAWRVQAEAARAFDLWRSGPARRELVLAALQDRALDWDRDLDLATMVSRFAQADEAHRALTLAEWRRVRALEQLALQRAAVDVTLRGTSAVPVRAVDTLALDAERLPRLARARLRADEAVLAYTTGRGMEPTTVFVLTRDTLLSHTLAPIDSLTEPIRAFAGYLAAGARPSALVQRLSRAVLTPALASLPPSITRLHVVADGDLHRLPFAALDAGDGRPLVARYTLVLAPSVEDALGSVRPIVAVRADQQRQRRAVLVGAPATMPAPVDGGAPWGALPGAQSEVRGIASLLQDAQALQGRAATWDALRTRLDAGGAVLHIATHVRADPGSFTRTALAMQPTATHDGLVTPALFASRPLPFDLVVLSSCASADGLLLAGQGLHGFVSSALDAGARGVVATRWAVGDTAIVPWMLRYYRRLLTAPTALDALTAVQRDAIAEGASPAVWANLVYAGDATVQVTLASRTPGWWTRVRARVRSWLGGAGREQP